MKVKTNKDFDAVDFFRVIKEKLASKMNGMTLDEQKKFMQDVRDGKIKLA